MAENIQTSTSIEKEVITDQPPSSTAANIVTGTSIDTEVITDQPPSYNEALNPLQHPTAPSTSEGFLPGACSHTENVQQQPPTAVLVQNIHTDGSTPYLLVCPNCQQQQLTLTEGRPRASKARKLCALCICCTGIWCIICTC